MRHSLTDWHRVVCGGGRTAQNARRTCAVRVAPKWGGGAFSQRKRRNARFFRVTRDFRLGVASAGRRAVVSRLSTAQKCPCNFAGTNFPPKISPCNFAGTNFPPKISPCGVQGQIFHQKFRPAVCRDKFSTKNFALLCAGTNFSPRISPCSVQGQIFHPNYRPAERRNGILAAKCANFNKNPKERTKTCLHLRQPS